MNISLAAAMRDPMLLGGPFAAPTFAPWLCVSKVLSGESLDRREAALFRKCTGRSRLPRKPVHKLFMVIGRRGGKSRFLSAVAVHAAALAGDWRSLLSAGERGVVLLLGADRRQAAVLKRYASGLIAASPLISAEVVRETGDEIEFRNGSVLEIGTNDYRAVRARTVLALIGDEACFWRTDEEAASSDEEVMAAAEPSMATTPGGGLLLLASSPYMKRGLLYRRWRELTGNDATDDVCWTAGSRVMNPALAQAVVDRAMADDPQRARAEFAAEWRDDLSDFVPSDVVEASTDFGVRERAPVPGVRYVAFTDAAGGTGSDSFTLAIGHREADGSAVLDVLRERKPRFVPAAVVAEYAGLLRLYRVDRVTGDRFAGGWASDEWARAGVRYEASARTKSELYLTGLPLLLSGRARLLDIAALRQQLANLERRIHRGGRERVDHAPSRHDDAANAAMGALVLAGATRRYDSSQSFVDTDRDGSKPRRFNVGDRLRQLGLPV
jgi:hypothetical protein